VEETSGGWLYAWVLALMNGNLKYIAEDLQLTKGKGKNYEPNY